MSVSTATNKAHDTKLQQALGAFQQALTLEQAAKLKAIKSVPDADAVTRFTTEIDLENAKRRSRCVATRLYDVLSSIQQFTAVVDTMVQSNPGTAALVWGSIKLVIMIASNFSSFFDKISSLIMSFRKHMPRFADYQTIYQDSNRLQTALCDFYATIVICCKQILEVTQRNSFTHMANAIIWPFENEFGHLQSKIQAASVEVTEEVRVAFCIAAAKEQILQVSEREEAKRHRRLLAKFQVGQLKDWDEVREWRLAKDKRAAILYKQRLLNRLSTYPYATPYKRARRKQCGDTTRWLPESQAYQSWVQCDQSALFQCSGRLGSGKTILTANAIAHLSKNTPEQTRLLYFFCQFDDPSSMLAEVVLGSIARQLYNDANLFNDCATVLESLLDSNTPDAEDLSVLLTKTMTCVTECFIVIDGLDDCDIPNRTGILKALRMLRSSSNAKVFLTMRNFAHLEVDLLPDRVYSVSTHCADQSSALAGYVRDSFGDQQAYGRRPLTDDIHLLVEIQDSLIKGAQGMFLWAAFLIDDIYAQDSDAEIRKVLADLPKDLPEIYRRLLNRIHENSDSKTAYKIFNWVACARRPMTCAELREAIAVHPDQADLEPDKYSKDMNRTLSRCRALIVVDDEDNTVQFTHNTVRHFLLSISHETSGPVIGGFQIKPLDFDRIAGHILVTYLNFDAFGLKVAKQRGPTPDLSPSDILNASLRTSYDSKLVKSIHKVAKWKLPKSSSTWDAFAKLSEDLGSSSSFVTARLHEDHAFLGYATEFWLEHTSNFPLSSGLPFLPFKRQWRRLLINEDSFQNMPWKATSDWSSRLGNSEKATGEAFVSWICQNQHTMMCAFVFEIVWTEENRHIGNVEGPWTIRLRNHHKGAWLSIELHRHDVEAVWTRAMFSKMQDFLCVLSPRSLVLHPVPNTLFHWIVVTGSIPLVKKWLDIGALINDAPSIDDSEGPQSGMTPLQTAVDCGYKDIVQLLLDQGVDVNGASSAHDTITRANLPPIALAISMGHSSIEQILKRERPLWPTLRIKLDKTRPENRHEGGPMCYSGLQLAVLLREYTVVEDIMIMDSYTGERKLNVNAASLFSYIHSSYSALELACKASDLAMVNILLTEAGPNYVRNGSHCFQQMKQMSGQTGHYLRYNECVRLDRIQTGPALGVVAQELLRALDSTSGAKTKPTMLYGPLLSAETLFLEEKDRNRALRPATLTVIDNIIEMGVPQDTKSIVVALVEAGASIEIIDEPYKSLLFRVFGDIFFSGGSGQSDPGPDQSPFDIFG